MAHKKLLKLEYASEKDKVVRFHQAGIPQPSCYYLIMRVPSAQALIIISRVLQFQQDDKWYSVILISYLKHQSSDGIISRQR